MTHDSYRETYRNDKLQEATPVHHGS